MKIPTITLYQPWASWIAVGLKTIETRPHARFRCLAGRRIAIHAGQAFDRNAHAEAFRYVDIAGHSALFGGPYADEWPVGVILCTAQVGAVEWLTPRHNRAALSDVGYNRVGLFLSDVRVMDPPIPARGARGIWYWEDGQPA